MYVIVRYNTLTTTPRVMSRCAHHTVQITAKQRGRIQCISTDVGVAQRCPSNYRFSVTGICPINYRYVWCKGAVKSTPVHGAMLWCVTQELALLPW